jgi:hypothetical protein
MTKSLILIVPLTQRDPLPPAAQSLGMNSDQICVNTNLDVIIYHILIRIQI